MFDEIEELDGQIDGHHFDVEWYVQFTCMTKYKFSSGLWK